MTREQVEQSVREVIGGEVASEPTLVAARAYARSLLARLERAGEPRPRERLLRVYFGENERGEPRVMFEWEGLKPDGTPDYDVSRRFACPPGYRVERIPGSHDGVGNENVRVLRRGEEVLTDVSVDSVSWLNGWLHGHAAGAGS